MKTVQAFVVGGICGAVITLGVMRWSAPHPGELPVKEAAESGATAEGSARSGTTGTASVEDAITSVKTWAGSRSARPNMPELTKKLSVWAEYDPMAAREFVMGAERFPDRAQALAVVLAVMAKEKPEEVANWAKANVPKTDWIDLFLPMFVFMQDEAPEQWLEFALSFPERESRDARLGMGRMLARVVEKSPEAAIRFYERVGEEERGDAAGKMLSEWAQRDVAGAIAWARQRPDVKAINEVWVSFLQDCAAARPDLVLDVVREAHGKGEDQSDYYSSAVVRTLLDVARAEGEAALELISKEAAQSAVSGWAGHNLEADPAGTLALLKRWVPENAHGEAIREGFKNWLRSDQQSARAWAATAADANLRALLRAGEFFWQAHIDPAVAMATLSGRSNMPLEIAEAAGDAFLQWSLEDAPEAAEWTLRNPALVSASQVARVAENLTRSDEAAALTWLAKLPGGELREAAVEEVARVWVKRSEFALADQIIASISDAERRQKMVFRVYRGVRSGPRHVQAEKWLEAQAIDAETKALWRREGGPE